MRAQGHGLTDEAESVYEWGGNAFVCERLSTRCSTSGCRRLRDFGHAFQLHLFAVLRQDDSNVMMFNQWTGKSTLSARTDSERELVRLLAAALARSSRNRGAEKARAIAAHGVQGHVAPASVGNASVASRTRSIKVCLCSLVC